MFQARNPLGCAKMNRSLPEGRDRYDRQVQTVHGIGIILPNSSDIARIIVPIYRLLIAYLSPTYRLFIVSIIVQ